MRKGFYLLQMEDYGRCIGYWTGSRWLIIAPNLGYLAPRDKLPQGSNIVREIEHENH
jgi:hypothetical protein